MRRNALLALEIDGGWTGLRNCNRAARTDPRRIIVPRKRRSLSTPPETQDRIAMLEAEVDELRGMVDPLFVIQGSSDPDLAPDRRLSMAGASALPVSQRPGSRASLTEYSTAAVSDVSTPVRRAIGGEPESPARYSVQPDEAVLPTANFFD